MGWARNRKVVLPGEICSLFHIFIFIWFLSMITRKSIDKQVYPYLRVPNMWDGHQQFIINLFMCSGYLFTRTFFPFFNVVIYFVLIELLANLKFKLKLWFTIGSEFYTKYLYISIERCTKFTLVFSIHATMHYVYREKPVMVSQK